MRQIFDWRFENNPGPFSRPDAEAALDGLKRIVLTLVAIGGVLVLAWIGLLVGLLSSLL
jgi:hypothetical protein